MGADPRGKQKGLVNGKGKYASSAPIEASRGAALDLEEVEPKLVAAAIVAIMAAGDAVLFGATRDGGAICITVLEGENRHKLYASGFQEIKALLMQLIDNAHGL